MQNVMNAAFRLGYSEKDIDKVLLKPLRNDLDVCRAAYQSHITLLGAQMQRLRQAVVDVRLVRQWQRARRMNLAIVSLALATLAAAILQPGSNRWIVLGLASICTLTIIGLFDGRLTSAQLGQKPHRVSSNELSSLVDRLDTFERAAAAAEEALTKAESDFAATDQQARIAFAYGLAVRRSRKR